MTKLKKVAFALIAILFLGAVLTYNYYGTVMGSGTGFKQPEKTIKVASDASFDQLVELLVKDSIVKSEKDFRQVAEWKRFSDPKGGQYRFTYNQSLNEIVNKLRSGNQTPVQLTFTGVRTANELAGQVAAQIEADSVALLQAVYSVEKAKEYGFSPDGFRAMFIPNTYEIWWNTNAEAFVERMAEEFKRFWNNERTQRAQELGLSQSEVTTLASIVKAETAKRDEAPTVAGLYLNRLEIGMALQADPTLIYAHDDFSIKRVLDVHKEINSPYNTYKNRGLPPGPINFPEPHYIDAVLEADEHKYLYMCAKEDFSGYHYFSKSLRQHNQYAAKYRNALRKLLREQRK